MDDIVTITPMPLCEPPARDEEEWMDAEWIETDRKILLLAARGELLDSEGNPVSALTHCNGVTTYYGVDLFELVVVKVEFD